MAPAWGYQLPNGTLVGSEGDVSSGEILGGLYKSYFILIILRKNINSSCSFSVGAVCS